MRNAAARRSFCAWFSFLERETARGAPVRNREACQGNGTRVRQNHMPIDARDQEVINSLPKLADVYEAYGVQVNALPVDEIFSLYERTGFLYPDKAARLLPHLEQVKENWRRMLLDRKSVV